MENTRRAWPTNLSKQGSNRLTETIAASMRHTWVCRRSSARVVAFSLVFLWDSEQWEKMCLWLFSWLLGLFDSYWVALYSLDTRTISLSYCYLVLLCLIVVSLEACFFLKGKLREVDLGQRGIGEKWGGKEGGELWLGCIVWEENLFSI